MIQNGIQNVIQNANQNAIPNVIRNLIHNVIRRALGPLVMLQEVANAVGARLAVAGGGWRGPPVDTLLCVPFLPPLEPLLRKPLLGNKFIL